MKRLTIQIPTYNEKENISILIPLIHKEIEKIDKKKWEINILIIDDKSPDGTGKIVNKIRKNYPNIFLLEGKKEGYGKACIKGFIYSIKYLKADYIIQMDADFSHNPKHLLEMINLIEKTKYNFIIGSRYISNGSIPSDWGKFRKLNSKFGNIFARYISGIRNVHDCTSGYRCIDTLIIDKINMNKLNVSGYSFLLSFLYFALKNGANIKEIPINFTNRIHGESKMSIKDILEFIKNSVGLRFK